MNYLKPLLLCLAVITSACSGPTYFEPLTPRSDNEAVLYIYRPATDYVGMQPLRFSYPDLVLNEKSIGVLEYNEHRSVHLTPGEYSLTATGLSKISKWEPKDKDLTFSIAAGEVKYVKLNIRYDLSKMNLGQPGAKYLIHLTPIDAEEAIYEIRETNVVR